MRLQVRSLPLLSGLRIWRCYELWCRSQMQLRSHVAVAVLQASGYSSDWTPSLGTSICRESGPRNGKRTKKKKKSRKKKHFSVRSSCCGAGETNLTGIHEDAVRLVGLGSGIAVSCGVGCGLDLAWLWLWCRPAAVALIGPLAWEPPYAVGVALKRKKNH